MLDLNYLRENIETARQRLAGRGFLLDVETFQRLDGERKSIIHAVERLRQLRNSASEEIAKLLREKVDVTAKRNKICFSSPRRFPICPIQPFPSVPPTSKMWKSGAWASRRASISLRKPIGTFARPWEYSIWSGRPKSPVPASPYSPEWARALSERS